MKKNQNGFGMSEILLIIAIIVALGLIGWGTWKKRQSSPQKSVTSQQASDEAVAKEKEETKSTGTDQKAVVVDKTVKSTSCKYLPSQNDSVALKTWKTRLGDTATIKALQTDQSAGVTYNIAPGSFCQLSDGTMIVTFSHNKITSKPGQSYNDTKVAHGLVMFSASFQPLLENSDLQCAYIPPDFVSAPTIEGVTNSQVTIICPGFIKPTNSFDLNTKTYSKL